MATQTPAVSTPGVFLLPIHYGSISASAVAAARLRMPFAVKVLGVSVAARSKTGTSPTLTADVKNAGTSILTAPVAVADGSVTEASLDSTKQQIADENELTVDFTAGGTSPVFNDVDVLITLARI